jgi:hypothetical protein
VVVWPLAVYFAAVILIVATMLSLSYVLGQRHKEPATGSPFESGIVSEGAVHVRLSVTFSSFSGRSPVVNWVGRAMERCSFLLEFCVRHLPTFGAPERSTGTLRDLARKVGSDAISVCSTQLP